MRSVYETFYMYCTIIIRYCTANECKVWTVTNLMYIFTVYDFLWCSPQVVRKTEVITKRIQELLISAQEGRQESFMPCADQIHSAVLDMDAIFPKVSFSSSFFSICTRIFI